MQALSVVYILLHFPYLTETFVAEEIHAVRSQGVDVHIVSLLEPGPGPTQPLSQQLLPHTWYAPGVLDPGLWTAQYHFVRREPRLYARLLVQLLRQPCPRRVLVVLAKRVVVFLKAVAAARYLQRRDMQLVHAHFAWLSGAAAWIIARLLGVPFTVTVHAYDVFSSKNDLLSLISSQAAHVIAISEYNKTQVVALGIRPPESISVIHCGVNLATLLEQPQTRIEHPAGARLRILSVGSLQAKKGHLYLIDACGLLSEQQVDFTCTIIGSGPDEPALRRQVQVCRLQDRVRLLGARSHPEITTAYRQHDLFVLASVVAPDGDRDGIPVVLMEAGKFGLPMVSTEVSGIPELVRHGQTGWLVPPGDPVALAEAITALATDPELRARLGQNARAVVEAEFTIERSASRLVALFQSISQPKDLNDQGEDLDC